jgi:membrane protease YdiL (CAAX protease family)
MHNNTQTLPRPLHSPSNIPAQTDTSMPGVDIPQLSKRSILAVWAAATAPMALAMWVVGPRLAHRFHGAQALTRSLLLCLTVALIWQFVLVATLVIREQRTLRWSVLRRSLWLNAPQSPRTHRRGGRVWLMTIPLILATGVETMIPSFAHPANRDFGEIVSSKAFQVFFHGNWIWFALIIVEFIFNTVLGEELLFRGYLLPRMNGAFGERDWLANGVLFAGYHVHIPWVIPSTLLDSWIISRPARRTRSALLGIVVHSAQSVFFAIGLLLLVVK